MLLWIVFIFSIPFPAIEATNAVTPVSMNSEGEISKSNWKSYLKGIATVLGVQFAAMALLTHVSKKAIVNIADKAGNKMTSDPRFPLFVQSMNANPQTGEALRTIQMLGRHA